MGSGNPIENAVELATMLVGLGHELLSGQETVEGAHQRIRDILPEKSRSELAAEQVERGRSGS